MTHKNDRILSAWPPPSPIAIQLGIGQHDLHRVYPSGPPDSRLAPDDAGRAVAPDDETEPGLLSLGW